MASSVRDRAAYIYDACEEIYVSANGRLWDVHDGLDGPCVGTVDIAVLADLEANYDSPVRIADGSDWSKHD